LRLQKSELRQVFSTLLPVFVLLLLLLLLLCSPAEASRSAAKTSGGLKYSEKSLIFRFCQDVAVFMRLGVFWGIIVAHLLVFTRIVMPAFTYRLLRLMLSSGHAVIKHTIICALAACTCSWHSCSLCLGHSTARTLPFWELFQVDCAGFPVFLRLLEC